MVYSRTLILVCLHFGHWCFTKGSTDPKQWCAEENTNVLLPFWLPQPDEKRVLSKILISFQNSTESKVEVLWVNIIDLSVVVQPLYAMRTNYTVSVLENMLYLTLYSVTAGDDGMYKCYHRQETIEECEIKLNIKNDRQQPIVSNSWGIFDGNSFEVNCDDSKFDNGKMFPYFIMLRIYRREIPNALTFYSFIELANYNFKRDEFQVKITIPPVRWTFGHNKTGNRLWLTITEATIHDSGEYACQLMSSYSEMSGVLKTFHSLISLVNVRAYYEPMEATNCQDATLYDGTDEKSAAPTMLTGRIMTVLSVTTCLRYIRRDR